MRETKVRFVPRSIGKLQNLETLDLKHTQVTTLPIEIGKLQKLRYLVFHGGFEVPAEIGNLSFLQKLERIDADQFNGNSIVGEVGKLTQLKSLKISELRTEDGKILCSSLENLSNLCSFGVSSTFTERFELLDLKTLSSGPPLLRKLSLAGRLEMTPHWMASLHSLVFLRLAGSGLRDGHPLQCLQGLYNLKSLRCVRFEQGATPHLERLNIWYCDLRGYPFGIEHLTNLRSIELVYVDLIKPQNLSDGDKDAWNDNKFAHIPRRDIRSYQRLPGHPSSNKKEKLKSVSS
ncbi:unnamed protein product [Ilex paraguariensis]|uniref:Disease resistance R13L4/SHOC-2-like LRR domain-containing protein n=1 Tax=Ilex paraguariensis TaxID=185542 RepID=A0ABC8RC24_9AQUA